MDNKRDLISSIFLLARDELRSKFTNYSKCILITILIFIKSIILFGLLLVFKLRAIRFFNSHFISNLLRVFINSYIVLGTKWAVKFRDVLHSNMHYML